MALLFLLYNKTYNDNDYQHGNKFSPFCEWEFIRINKEVITDLNTDNSFSFTITEALLSSTKASQS